MLRSSSLLDVFSVVVVSAGGGRARIRRPLYCRSELMFMQLRHGKTPCPELVIDGGLSEMHPLRPPRGETETHASYRVTRLQGAVLHTHLLLPRIPGVAWFRVRVRHPDGTVDRLRPLEADGLVTEARLAIRLRPGMTIVDIERAGRIDVHWDGAGATRARVPGSRAPVGEVVGRQR